MASYRTNTPPARPLRLARSRITIAVAAATMAFSGTAHGINLANTPLFLQDSALPPNILFIPDTSESMQESPDGRLAMDQDNPLCQPGPDLEPDIDYNRAPEDDVCPAGARHPNSKGSIVKRVGLNLVNQYEGQVNLGLMSYQQMPASNNRNAFNAGGTVRWRLVERAIDTRFSTDPEPDWYDPDFEGAWDSSTKRFRAPHPTRDNIWIFFNDGVPGYFWDTGDGSFGTPTSDQTEYRWYTGNTSQNNPPDGFQNNRYADLRTFGGTQTFLDPDSGLYFASPTGTINTFLVDSQRQRNITSWGQRAVFFQYNQLEWRNTQSPGLGYLHVPVGGLNEDGSIDSDHWEAIRTKLQPQRHDWDGTGNPMSDPSWPLIASGLTPLEGTMQTARDYFLQFVHPDESGDMTGTPGSALGNNQGSDNAAQMPRSCGVNAAIWVTDGLPSVSADGIGLGADLPQALEDAQQAVANFHNDTGVSTYIVGFALPPGVSGIPGMPENPLNLLAEAGGTGTAFDATDEEGLDLAMSQIFEAIIAEATGSASSVAAASTTYQPDGTNLVYQASFNSADWSGDLRAFDFLLDQGVFSEQWVASEALPQPQNRNIFSYDGNEGISFDWNNLSATQQQILSDAPVLSGGSNLTGPDLLAYLRGDPSHELQNGGEWRNRSNPLGNFINSSPAVQTPNLNFGYSQMDGYTQFRSDNQTIPEVVYVGGNAGMLHAFDGQTGEELFAFVPNAVFDKLPDLADPNYSHQFFVDGQQTIAHAQIDGSWRTVLVGTLGAGGRGIYALDVTDPTSFSADNILWELSGDDISALGHTFGAPTVAQTANGQWSALFANGYGSDADEAILIVANLASGSVFELGTGATGGNGLSEATFRANAEGVIQDGFAGDLQGNLWKFDISNTNTTNQWGANLHFQATAPNGETQPITARPTVGTHPGGGSIVLFGTGKYLENADNQVPSPAPVQSFYGIRDYDSISTPVSRNNLYRNEFIGEGVIEGFNVRATSSGEGFDSSVHEGWYIDLDYPSPEGERVVERAQIVGGRVEFVTLTPSDDPCAGGGSSSLVALDAATGGRPNDPVFDLNNDGDFGVGDMINIDGEDIPVSAVDPGIGIMATPTVVQSPDGTITRILGGTDADGPEELAGPGTGTIRPRSWIQLR
ncbi:pilus assembly protein [Thioalkalivibrio sp. ALJ16]|uniref:pilus assembly protein n=1 Tax=Thioalkalivibrio sp. ALJ16 TaxID=1158762 RepID=UPI00039FEC25|nr:PilC/PilY family type IV pilus protein [Thioalkalivibrio sp. ALJ16]